MHVLRYLQGQRKNGKRMVHVLNICRDYLDMARDLGCNMAKRAILEPRDLKASMT